MSGLNNDNILNQDVQLSSLYDVNARPLSSTSPVAQTTNMVAKGAAYVGVCAIFSLIVGVIMLALHQSETSWTRNAETTWATVEVKDVYQEICLVCSTTSYTSGYTTYTTDTSDYSTLTTSTSTSYPTSTSYTTSTSYPTSTSYTTSTTDPNCALIDCFKGYVVMYFDGFDPSATTYDFSGAMLAQINGTEDFVASPEEALEPLAGYNVGDEYNIFYNPLDVTDWKFEDDVYWGKTYLIVGIIFIILGVLACLFAFIRCCLSKK